MPNNKNLIIFVPAILILSSTNHYIYSMEKQNSIPKQSQETIDEDARKTLNNAKKTDIVYISSSAHIDLQRAGFNHNRDVEELKKQQARRQQAAPYAKNKKQSSCMNNCIPIMKNKS